MVGVARLDADERAGAVLCATGSAVWWVSFGRPLRGWAQGFKGVVAPFFGAVSVLFALQAVFLANDVVVRNREAVAAVNGEADTIREVFALSVASASDMTVIHRTLVEYLRAVLADECLQPDLTHHPLRVLAGLTRRGMIKRTLSRGQAPRCVSRIRDAGLSRRV
jgi:hypothetical protein